MEKLKPWFLVVDLGFIAYWLITLFHLIPQEYLFKDYENPILVAWNWSFLPLDLFISATGLSSLYLYRKRNPAWSSLAFASLLLTSCSGLQAIAFWAIRRDFDPLWWSFNLFLLCYPFAFFPGMLRQLSEARFQDVAKP